MIKSILKSDDFKLKNCINYIAVIAVLVILTVLNSMGELKASYMNLFVQIGYSIILAVSLNLVVGFLGELSLGHAGFMSIGAFAGAVFGITSFLQCLGIAPPVGRQFDTNNSSINRNLNAKRVLSHAF